MKDLRAPSIHHLPLSRFRCALLNSFLVLALAVLSRPAVAQVQTEATVHAVSHLDMSAMDLAADPCVDFYQYACGNFKKNHPLQEGEDYVFLAELQRTNAEGQILHFLEQPNNSLTADGKSVRGLHAYFDACMDSKSIDRSGLAALGPILRKIDRYQNSTQLADLAAHLTLIKANPFFTLSALPGQSSPRRLIYSIGEPNLGLPAATFYLGDGDAERQVRTDYLAHIARVFSMLGQTGDAAALNAERVLRAETMFAKAKRSAVADRDPFAHNVTMDIFELQKAAPQFNWDSFFTVLGSPAPETIAVDNVASILAFQSLLEKGESETIRAYILFKTTISIPQTFQTSKLAAENREFGNAVGGHASIGTRTDACFLQLVRARPDDVARLYVKHFLPPDLKDQAMTLVDNIQQQFAHQLDEATWLNDSTRQSAQEKLKSVSKVIAFDSLSHDYASMQVKADAGLMNYLRAVEYSVHGELNDVGKPIKRDALHFFAVAPGAQYDSDLNEIEIPAAQLTAPSFDKNGYVAENYARAGFIIGHELIHGFDDKGRFYDREGLLKNWWTKDDSLTYNSKAECFVKEYSQFGIDDAHHINGRLTLGENIADNGGLHLSLLAFLSDAKAKGVDVGAANDGFTLLQRFFLAYAQDTCSSVRPESERIQIQNNPHSLDRFRAKGVLQNLSKFGEAFSCKRGQPMMPEKTCGIW